MTITFPLSMPASPVTSDIKLSMVNIVGESVSPFTASRQVQEFGGEWWTAQCSIPPIVDRTLAEPWICFLAALRGKSGSFLLGDPRGGTPLGVATGTPLVNGAQSGGSKTLNTKGWTINVTGILKTGSYLQIGTGLTQRLYKVLTDANSDASGHATFDIFPRLRAEGVTDGQAITLVNCKGVFALDNNQRDWDFDSSLTYGISFTAKEAI